ncbi:MAG: hypothetical protein GY754_19795 [bacterium]|nr:hypothetical protein [bacterium]
MLKLPKHKKLFEDILNQVLEDYPCEVMGYVILDSHFHLIIRSVEKGPTISEFMQVFKSVFARAYNKSCNRSGAFWQKRFSDVIVEAQSDSKRYFKRILWYLAFNPIRAFMEKNPRDYKYSSINAYLNKNYEPRVPITYHEIYLELGNTFEERRERLLDYEEIYKGILLKKYKIEVQY